MESGKSGWITFGAQAQRRGSLTALPTPLAAQTVCTLMMSGSTASAAPMAQSACRTVPLPMKGELKFATTMHGAPSVRTSGEMLMRK